MRLKRGSGVYSDIFQTCQRMIKARRELGKESLVLYPPDVLTVDKGGEERAS